MKARDIPLLLQDMVEAINQIQMMTKNLSYEEFLDNDKTYLAIVERISRISEIGSRMPTIVRAKHSLIPWTAIDGLFESVSRKDLGTDPAKVWKVATEYLQVVKPQIEQMIEESMK